MHKDMLAGGLALFPLFALFAIFVAALYFRSRFNRSHPQAERTAAQRLRAKIIGGIIYALVLAALAYLILKGDRFAPSWSATFFIGMAAFVLGEALGRRNAMRRIEGKPDQATEPVVFF